MNIPLHFMNAEIAPGVKTQGGIVSHLMAEVEVKCLPGDLPEFIEVDLAKLDMGDSLHLPDLKLPKNVELTALAHGKEYDQPVVSIHKPTAAQEETPVTEENIASETKAGESEGQEEA